MAEEEGSELRIAFGPVGLAGLVLLVPAIRKRSPVLAVAGGVALWADVNLAALRGWKAMRFQAGG